MRITLDQYPGLIFNLTTIARVDLSDNDQDMLIELAQLLERARANVERALDAQLDAATERARRQIEADNESYREEKID